MTVTLIKPYFNSYVPANDNIDISRILINHLKDIEEDAKMAHMAINQKDPEQIELWCAIFWRMLNASYEGGYYGG